LGYFITSEILLKLALWSASSVEAQSSPAYHGGLGREASGVGTARASSEGAVGAGNPRFEEEFT